MQMNIFIRKTLNQKLPLFHRIIQTSYAHYFNSQIRTKSISSSDLRKLFIDYFVNENGHTFIPSSSIIPKNDPLLLFTSAGMNQFKPVFLGLSPAPAASAANSQKCARLGGKHNDLADVGRDVSHHTFFEMLGSWSFSDYYKEEACMLAWTFLKDRLQLPTDRLYVTYFKGDPDLGLEPDWECRDIWLKLGVPPAQLLGCSLKDNFWEMAQTGPCGPCTEIHFDHLGGSGRAACVNKGLQDLVEIWNLVFIQYNRQPDGSLTPLSSRYVDTGMGLERLSAVLQGSTSNYDTDLFQPIFQHIHRITQKTPYGGILISPLDIGYRIVADHIRMACIAIADGVLPDSHDAGNCVRKVIKKALYLLQTTFQSGPGALAALADSVADSLGPTYPEIYSALPQIKQAILEEEERFLHFLEGARKSLLKISHNAKVLSGDRAWDLLIQHGLQPDILEDLCQSYGLSLDWEQLEARRKLERDKSGHVLESKLKLPALSAIELLKKKRLLPTNDSFKYKYTTCENYYRFEPVEGEVAAIVTEDSNLVHQATSDVNNLWVVTNKTNFFAEEGGQTSDQGLICGKDWTFAVDHVVKSHGYVFHYGSLKNGTMTTSSTAHLMFDEMHRVHCMRNHTATHLLNAVLRSVRPGTYQKSSLVTPQYLRFNFHTKKSLSDEEISKLESAINSAIEQHLDITRSLDSRDRVAQISGILASVDYQEYPEEVSVIHIGESHPHAAVRSAELCCGTHLLNTAHLARFVVTEQKSRGQNERILYAVTGNTAISACLLADKLEEEIELLGAKTTDVKMADSLRQEFLSLQMRLEEVTVPYVKKHQLEAKLKALNKKIAQLQKKDAIQKFMEELSGLPQDRPYLVHHLATRGNRREVFNNVLQWLLVRSRPTALAFQNREGGRTLFLAFVPQERVSSDFDATSWLNRIKDKLTSPEEIKHGNYNSHNLCILLSYSGCHENLVTLLHNPTSIV